MKIACPNPECNKSYSIADSHLGKTATCKHCGQKFTLNVPGHETRRPAATTDTNGVHGTSQRGELPPKLGRFEIRALLGAGAFGTVYRGYDPTLDREVALKVPHPGTLQTKADKTRFLREPKAAAQLRHPNIVPVYEAGVADGQYFIAAAYIEGQTLQESIEGGRFEFRQAARIVMDLAGALDYAHQQGIVHRDVKPGNIMLDADGVPLLMDFGLARMAQSHDKLTMDGTVLGTPAYMSPEQASARHDEVGPSSDQYSLGVVLYELLCGRTPFSGPPSLVISSVINQEPPSPKSVNPRIPKDLGTICLKAMAKSQQRRFADCASLAEDLRRWLDGDPIRARRLNPAERLWRWTRRNSVEASLMTVAALLLISITVVTSVGWLRTARNLAGATEQWWHAQEQQRLKDESLERESEELAHAQSEAERVIADSKRAVMEREKVIAERKRMEPILYAAQINLAHAELLGNNPSSAKAILDSCSSSFRHWEWVYLKRNCGGSGATLPGHADVVTALAFSADGRRLASASRDTTVKVWDVSTGTLLQTLRGHSDWVTSVALSPDGMRVVSGSKDQTVKVWNVASGDTLHTQNGVLIDTHSVQAVAFSPEGGHVAAGSQGSTKIWDVATGEELLTASGWSASQLAFSPDGRWLVSGNRTLDSTTGEEIAVLSGRHITPSGIAAVSPNGDRIATRSGFRGYDGVLICSISTGQELARISDDLLAIEDVVLCFSRDGRYFMAAITSGSIFKIWDAATGDELRTVRGPDPESTAIAISPDGKQVASASAAFRRDGRGNWSTDGAVVKIWSTDAKSTKNVSVNHGRSTAVSPNGNRIAVEGQDSQGVFIKISDVPTSRELLTLRGHRQSSDLAFSSDGKRIVTIGFNDMTIWDAETGQLIRTVQSIGGPQVVFSPDGKRVTTSGSKAPIRIVDTNTGDEILEIGARSDAHGPNGFSSVVFSPDGDRIAAGCRSGIEGAVMVWNCSTGEELLTLRGHSDTVVHVAFSPDGRRIVSMSDGPASMRKKMTKIWDAVTGRELLTLLGQEEGPCQLSNYRLVWVAEPVENDQEQTGNAANLLNAN